MYREHLVSRIRKALQRRVQLNGTGRDEEEFARQMQGVRAGDAILSHGTAHILGRERFQALLSPECWFSSSILLLKPKWSPWGAHSVWLFRGSLSGPCTAPLQNTSQRGPEPTQEAPG